MIGQALRRGINAHRATASTAPTFIASRVTRSTGSTSTTVAGLTGSAVAVGDILVAFAAGSLAANNVTVTPPAGLGWVEIGDSGAGNARSHVWVTTATSADQTGGTWGWSGGTDTHVVAVLAYRNVVQPTTAGVTGTALSATTIDAPSRTTVGAGALFLVWASHGTNGTAPSWSGTMTNRFADPSGSGGGLAADEVRATAGATGARTFTAGGISSAMTAASVVLEPA